MYTLYLTEPARHYLINMLQKYPSLESNAEGVMPEFEKRMSKSILREMHYNLDLHEETPEKHCYTCDDKRTVRMRIDGIVQTVSCPDCRKEDK